MRLPSLMWMKLKWRLCSLTALYIRTGTLTSPKEMAPDQIERGIGVPFGCYFVSQRPGPQTRPAEQPGAVARDTAIEPEAGDGADSYPASLGCRNDTR